ncbi:MAG: hypothetical protein GY793_08300 [Proteobacteria bacterium]|nr:hypothetical protein [Pseudomonadota bacterium]
MTTTIDDNITQAKNRLNLARKNSLNGSVDEDLKFMNHLLKVANTSLEDIGSSEKEISTLRETGYLNEAKEWLVLAINRHTSEDVDNMLNYMYKYLEKAGASLEEIGSSKEKIQKLRS